jgi:hypothetical protein
VPHSAIGRRRGVVEGNERSRKHNGHMGGRVAVRWVYARAGVSGQPPAALHSCG